MIEAVGWEWFDTYFRHCSELLDARRALLPAGDRRRRRRLRDREAHPQLRQPGDLPGRLPALGASRSRRSIADQTDLRTVALEDISSSYVLTLRAWRERFEAATERLEELGYDDRFRRTWSLLPGVQRGGLRRDADPRRPDALRQAALVRIARTSTPPTGAPPRPARPAPSPRPRLRSETPAAHCGWPESDEQVRSGQPRRDHRRLGRRADPRQRSPARTDAPDPARHGPGRSRAQVGRHEDRLPRRRRRQPRLLDLRAPAVDRQGAQEARSRIPLTFFIHGYSADQSRRLPSWISHIVEKGNALSSRSTRPTTTYRPPLHPERDRRPEVAGSPG